MNKYCHPFELSKYCCIDVEISRETYSIDKIEFGFENILFPSLSLSFSRSLTRAASRFSFLVCMANCGSLQVTNRRSCTGERNRATSRQDGTGFLVVTRDCPPRVSTPSTAVHAIACNVYHRTIPAHHTVKFHKRFEHVQQESRHVTFARKLRLIRYLCRFLFSLFPFDLRPQRFDSIRRGRRRDRERRWILSRLEGNGGEVSLVRIRKSYYSLYLSRSLERGESNLGARKNALPAHKIFRAIFPSLLPAVGWNRVTTTLCVAKRLLRIIRSVPRAEGI